MLCVFVLEAPMGVLCSAALIPYEHQPGKPRHYPEPLPRDELVVGLERSQQLNKGLGRAMNRSYNTFVRHKRTQRPHKAYLSLKERLKDTDLAEMQTQAAPKSGRGSSLSARGEGDVEYVDLDLDNFLPSSDEDVDSDYDGRGGEHGDVNAELTRIWGRRGGAHANPVEGRSGGGAPR